MARKRKSPPAGRVSQGPEPNIHIVRFDDIREGWEQWVLLMSDEHWDHPQCNRELLTRHHQEAADCEAGILKFGDTFCLMQGKADPRHAKGNVRPEHQRNDYFDAVVADAVKYYLPYKDHIWLWGQGNHETSVEKRLETNPLSRLSRQLRLAGSRACFLGGYSGFVHFKFAAGTHRLSRRLFYHHGFGGGGYSTKGKNQWLQYADYADADIYVSGHIHQKEFFPKIQARLSDASRHERRQVLHVRCGTYKDEYGTGEGGYQVRKGQGPRPLGGWWLRFFWHRGKLHTEVTEACE